MKMCDYIKDFSVHLTNAIEIGRLAKLKKSNKKFKNILVCGLGGSGIGGTIVSDIISPNISIPILTTKDYTIPGFVDNNTLVVVSSYSGNTEETISALKKCLHKKAEICIITSGGELKKLAKKNSFNYIEIPSGHPPRAMFGYAFTELFYVLHHYGIIDNSFLSDFKKSIELLNSEGASIRKKAKEIAKKIHKTKPVIYVCQGFEGIAIRCRQQINENSKMLCWHHVIPEMNHNELLGWRKNVDGLSVLFFRNKSDFNKNQIRMDINKKILSKYTANICEVWSKGGSVIEETLYHINFGDWVSWYLSELNNVDAIEIDVINYLKQELAKIQ